MRLAAEAHHEQNMKNKCEKLKEAYVHEAFAAHYLTDLFSAGHLRPARRYLHTQSHKEMAGAGVVQSKLFGGQKEVPIWDFQGRYVGYWHKLIASVISSLTTPVYRCMTMIRRRVFWCGMKMAISGLHMVISNSSNPRMPSIAQER